MKSWSDIPKPYDKEIDVSLPAKFFLLEENLSEVVSKTKEPPTGRSFSGERVSLEELTVEFHQLTKKYNYQLLLNQIP